MDATTGVNTWQAGAGRSYSYLVLKTPKPEVETALAAFMAAGQPRPTNLTFNTAYYCGKGGTCRITSHGEDDANSSAVKAFDGNDQTAWLDKAALSWIQCQYGEGRKYLVTSYLLVQADASGNLVCRWRNKTGDQDDSQKKELGQVTLPIHLKLLRTGQEIQVFASTDAEDGHDGLAGVAPLGEA